MSLAARPRLLTAAELAGEIKTPRADPAHFIEGMLVRHPTYGIGRVASLSGYGDARKAVIRFTVGDSRTFVIAKSPLSPVKAG